MALNSKKNIFYLVFLARINQPVADKLDCPFSWSEEKRFRWLNAGYFFKKISREV